jgi:hypothetical protein
MSNADPDDVGVCRIQVLGTGWSSSGTQSRLISEIDAPIPENSLTRPRLPSPTTIYPIPFSSNKSAH